jgi:hypothetical protein
VIASDITTAAQKLGTSLITFTTNTITSKFSKFASFKRIAGIPEIVPLLRGGNPYFLILVWPDFMLEIAKRSILSPTELYSFSLSVGTPAVLIMSLQR